MRIALRCLKLGLKSQVGLLCLPRHCLGFVQFVLGFVEVCLSDCLGLVVFGALGLRS